MKMINSCNLKKLEIISDKSYEVEMYKSQIKMDNPIQISFFILQYAKLQMLEFYDDCLVRYLHPNYFELTEADSDGMYMTLNEESMDNCI